MCRDLITVLNFVEKSSKICGKDNYVCVYKMMMMLLYLKGKELFNLREVFINHGSFDDLKC
jgi:hypothetical protein